MFSLEALREINEKAERTHCTECGKWIGDDGHDGRCLEHADPVTLDEEELAEMALELVR